MANNFDEYSLSTKFDPKPWALPVKFFLRYKWRTALMLLTTLFSASIEAVYPNFASYAIDNFIEKGTLKGLFPFAMAYLGTLCLTALGTIIMSRECMFLEMTIGKDMRDSAFEHTQKLPLSFYNTTPVGYLISRIMGDTNQLGNIFSWRLSDFIYDFWYLISVLFMMVVLSPKMALLVFTIVPFGVIVCTFFQRRLLLGNRAIRRANSAMVAAFSEDISGAKTIKSLSANPEREAEFKVKIDDLYNKAITTKTLQSIFGPTVMFMGSCAFAIVLSSSGLLMRMDGFDMATFVVFVTYTLSIVEPIQTIIGCLTDVISTQANVERIHRLMTTEPLIKDTPEVEAKYGTIFEPKKENWEDIEGHIVFEDVTFMYPDGEVNVLEHFNLDIKAGSSVAIVGETGAGKSTLVNLACRFYEPTGGRILLDGKDLKERSLLWLHSQIGYVLQTPHLFSGTIAENIRYGKPDATDEEVINAAKTACAHDFIVKLNKGYDTQVGEGGDRLSVGQKQLISIARAIIGDPKIFVLDEATSSIDTETEALIQKITAQIMKGRTTFMIAHRLSTVRDCDVILVVKDGKIIEKGSHRELIAAKGHYYSLYTRQFEDSKLKEVFQQ